MTKTLLEIVQDNGLRLTQRGNKWSANCPFHRGDRTPSFFIYPNMTYFCFGCRVWGDAIKFLMEFNGMSYGQAVDIAGKRERKIKKVIKVKSSFAIWPYLYEVANKYHDFLKETPGAIEYLHGRGLTDDTINDYRIGYTDGWVIDIDETDSRLGVSSGVLTEEGRESLAHRITIPNILPGGYCDFIMGRTVTKNEVRYLGLPIPKPIYGLLDVKDSPIVFLVEGHFDWLLLKQWGYPAIAASGTNLSPANVLPLKNKMVVIVPDNDDEGMQAAEALHEKLSTSIILDYASLGAKDVGELKNNELFDEKVRDQVNWIEDLSPMTLEKWFPRFQVLTHSP